MSGEATRKVISDHLVAALANIVKAHDDDGFEYAPTVVIETIRAAVDDGVPVRFVERICAEGDHLWDEVES